MAHQSSYRTGILFLPFCINWKCAIVGRKWFLPILAQCPILAKMVHQSSYRTGVATVPANFGSIGNVPWLGENGFCQFWPDVPEMAHQSPYRTEVQFLPIFDQFQKLACKNVPLLIEMFSKMCQIWHMNIPRIICAWSMTTQSWSFVVVPRLGTCCWYYQFILHWGGV